MTSKEMEERSGVARANIRYYEAEGLLSPRRAKNGYRDYREEDLLALEKIKLLRRLGVTVEELRALCSGSEALPAVLERRLTELGKERQTLRRVEEVCGAMRNESFETLDAERYLQALDAPEEGPEVPDLPEEDALPTVCSVPRRLLARLADFYLCVALFVLPAALCGVNMKAVEGGAFLTRLAAIALMALLEPLCLHAFAATPGKALMGLRITRADGTKLSWLEGFERFCSLHWDGLGLFLPIWHWVQLYRSGMRCSEGEPQPWDRRFAYRMKGSPLACGLAFAAAAGGFIGCDKLLSGIASLPPNRGALTVAEFAENYNRQADYLNVPVMRLDENGRFTREQDDNSVVINITDWEDTALDYTLQDDRITAVTYTGTGESRSGGLLELPRDTMMLLASAFLWAREDAPLLAEPRVAFLEEMAGRGMEDYTLSDCGVTVALNLEYTGYRALEEYLFLEEGEAGHAAFTFTMTLEE